MIRKKDRNNNFVIVFGDIVYYQLGECWSNEVGSNPFVEYDSNNHPSFFEIMFTADDITENKILYPNEDREFITKFQDVEHMKAVGCGTKNIDTINHLLKIGDISTKQLIARYNQNLPMDIQLRLARDDNKEILSELACNINLCVEAMYVLVNDDYGLTRFNLAAIKRNNAIPDSLIEFFATDMNDTRRAIYYKNTTPQYILEYLHCHHNFKSYDKSHFSPALLKILNLEQSFIFNC